MLEFGQVRFQISSYFGNKQTSRSLFAMSVGMGWGRGIARWGLKPKVWPSKCLCAECDCAGLPAGPAGRRAGITAVPSRPGPASPRPEADPATFQRVQDFGLVWAV